MRGFLLFAVLLIASPATWAGEQALTNEVCYLLDSVSESGCKFVRIGKEHTADEAADHLRMKAKRGKRYYDSTEEFILSLIHI